MQLSQAQDEARGRSLLTGPCYAGKDGRALIDLLCSQGLRATVIARSRGRLGPVLSSRATMLRDRGLVGETDEEDLLVIRGQLAKAAR